jgi:hypothetical protein
VGEFVIQRLVGGIHRLLQGSLVGQVGEHRQAIACQARISQVALQQVQAVHAGNDAVLDQFQPLLRTLELPESGGTDEQQRQQGCRESEDEALGNGHDGKLTEGNEARRSTRVQLQNKKNG